MPCFSITPRRHEIFYFFFIFAITSFRAAIDFADDYDEPLLMPFYAAAYFAFSLRFHAAYAFMERIYYADARHLLSLLFSPYYCHYDADAMATPLFMPP